MRYYPRPESRDLNPKRGRYRRGDNSPSIKPARLKEERLLPSDLQVVRNTVLNFF